MKRSTNRGDRSLAEEVLGYLREHPEAQDTVEGIAGWWLAEERIRHSVADITAVLFELVARKLVLVRQGTDGRIHYRLNPKKKREIGRRLHLPASGRASERRRFC